MMNLVAGVCVAFVVTAGIAAQTEPCTLNQENAQCASGSECCSRCCTAGLCSNEGKCFSACDSSKAATVEGPSLCRLSKSIDELADLVKTVIISDLNAGVPVLAGIFRTVNAFFADPSSGLSSMVEVIKDVHALGSVFNTTIQETRLILDDVNDIITTSINLITKLMSPQSQHE